ncbi:Cyclin-J [Pseudolycoriella hygida]|uniref:Cyclin-J n=1 Tax=Pseudolycoriella hygida TaxID=35572 RepID=A0A9Q0N612_9DIPT|nr:Cyclin-J [Pseudolycoriella hygida]
MEITPKNQNTVPASESKIRNRLKTWPNSITPEECTQKTFIKLNLKTVEQQCDVKSKVLSHWWYTDYADDIIDELRKSESLRVEFYRQSPQIAYRNHCVNFMREVVESEFLSRTTLHLGNIFLDIFFFIDALTNAVFCGCFSGIYYLDVFMDRHRIAADRLSLVVLCCLGLAAKLEDRDQDVPKYSDLNSQMNDVYTIKDYAKLEGMIMQSFGFKLIYPTAAVFVEYYIEASINETDFQKCDQRFNSYVDMKAAVASLVLEVLDLILNDREMVQILPSKSSAACIAAGRKLAGIENVWTTELALLTNYLFKDIEQLTQDLMNCHSEMTHNIPMGL